MERGQNKSIKPVLGRPEDTDYITAEMNDTKTTQLKNGLWTKVPFPQCYEDNNNFIIIIANMYQAFIVCQSNIWIT